MNQSLLRLKYLRDKVIDIEVHIALIESDLIATEKDLDFLDNLYKDLKENIDTLREDGIIVVASEYKKITQELEKVRKNIFFYNNMYSKLLLSLDEECARRDETLLEYEEFLKYVESIQSVLKFDLSRKKK